MRFDSFSGDEFLMMLVGSANLLAEHRAEIDALNVFPVPDGDTGTNMHLTFYSGIKEAMKMRGSPAGEIAASMAQGTLLGARGNSGVILSQIMHGFAMAMEGKNMVYTADVARSFTSGTEAAYSAVMNPTEGTMLTVIRRAAEAFNEGAKKEYDLLKSVLLAYRNAQQALAETPMMLPVLREAGVVDAGGKGIVIILEGVVHALKKAAARQDLQLFDLAATQQKEFISRGANISPSIEYTYCTEFLVRGATLQLDQVRKDLAPYGDCVMVVGNADTAKVHIHSNHPGLVLECCLRYGALHDIHVNNMEEQNKKFRDTEKWKKPIGVVSVGYGEGIQIIMESMGADIVVAGGQTMNPSAQAILEAIDQVSAGKVLVLPNNGNVVMAAEQAAALSSKDVRVVRTGSVPGGLAALMMVNPYGDLDDIAEKMKRSADVIRSGEVTRAVRDTTIKGVIIKNGQYIGLNGDDILTVKDGPGEALEKTIEALVGDDDQVSFITLYYGADIRHDQAREHLDSMQKRFSGIEFESHYGGQPHHQYIISAE